jgi:UDP-N-acetylmuramoylalanine-D-glutamate ligase
MLAIIAAIAIDAEAVAMSNESSADEPTRVVESLAVNHQWSKTSEAEKMLRDALDAEAIDINYFSLLRDLDEFDIFQIFAELDDYHSVFTSCNKAFTLAKEKRSLSWCGNCDKCRFVFLAMCGFRGLEYATKIIGVNMFDDASQTQGFLDLIGADKKPFECVGTVRDSRLFIRHVDKWTAARNSVIGKALLDAIASLDALEEKHPTHVPSFLPSQCADAVINAREKWYRDHIARHARDESYGVLGLGRDTAALIKLFATCGVTQKIKVYLPDMNADFATQVKNNDLNDIGLELIRVNTIEEIDADVVLVSPGISKYSDDVIALGERATTPLVWWLNFHLDHFPNKCLIGVTGTKGKSTTSSMLSHVLDRAIVAGNLGNAVGNISPRDIIESDVVVLEVSSFQASYITQSPDIAVLTSFFDCHLDWHRTSENYRRDKMNLFEHGPLRIFTTSEEGSIKERNEKVVRDVVHAVEPSLSDDDITSRLLTFMPLKYREEVIAEKSGVTFISDVLATAVGATINSLRDVQLSYPDSTIYLLYGGSDRDHDQKSFASQISSFNNVVVITLPETGYIAEQYLSDFIHAEDLNEGVTKAMSKAKPGDVIVLAPGAPSFHQYKDYVELAQRFEDIVSAL